MFVYIAFVQNKFVVKILVERIGGDGAPIRKFQRVRAVIADGWTLLRGIDNIIDTDDFSAVLCAALYDCIPLTSQDSAI